MPQMMPINWLFSFFFFLCIFILFNIFNYYIFNYNYYTEKKKNYLTKIFLWKW